MLLQTNSYIVPKDKRTEHARLIKRFRSVMVRLGCESFDVYEQAGPNWSGEVGGRFVQLMTFRDRDHQKKIKDAEQSDPVAQELVREFCDLINFRYQHEQGLATTAFYLGLSAPPQLARPADPVVPALPDAPQPPVDDVLVEDEEDDLMADFPDDPPARPSPSEPARANGRADYDD